jgi:hypothetical protein
VKKVIIIVISTIFVALAVILISFNFIGDKVVEEIVSDDFDKLIDDEYNKEINGIESEYVDNNSNGENIKNENNAANIAVDINGSDSNRDSDSDSNSNSNSNSDSNAGTVEEGSSSGSLESNSIGNGKKNVNAGEIEIADMKQIKDKISTFDKVKVAAIVVKKFSTSEMNELRGMISGGISKTEKSRVKEIVTSNLDSDEIYDIKDMYKKYAK